MRFATKLLLLVAGVLGLAIAGIALAVFGTHQAQYSLARADLAHRSYEAHLSLSNHTYQLFKQFGDAMIIGDLDKGALETKLLADIRRDITNIRSILVEEIRLVGESEAVELENLAQIERKIDGLLAEYQAVLTADYNVPLEDEWGRLSRILDEKVDLEFNRLIQNALDEELREVNEVQARKEARVALTHQLALILALVGTTSVALSLRWIVRDLKEPVTRLIRGAEAFAGGDLGHRIDAQGNSELASVARAFNRMAAEVATRATALESANQRLEQAVSERTGELERLLATLRTSEADRRRLLADVSHELRTPLTIIRGEADIALRGGEKPAAVYRDALERSRDAAEHTARLVDDLLFVARREAGHARISLRELDLGELVSAVVEETRSLAEGRGATVEFRSTADAGLVRGDPSRLRQVMIILLENAVRYGGGTVVVGLDRCLNGFRIAVRDDGPGLSKADQERVFDRFFRGSNAASRYSQGTGLGLPVAKAIVEAHGGGITIDSELGQGTTVTVVVPARPRLEAVS